MQSTWNSLCGEYKYPSDCCTSFLGLFYKLPCRQNSSCVHFHLYLETLPDLPGELIIPNSKPREPCQTKWSAFSEIPHGGLHCTMTVFLFTQQAVWGPQKEDFGPFHLVTRIVQLGDPKSRTWQCESGLGDVPKKWMTPKRKFKGEMVSTHERDTAPFQHLAKGRVQVPGSLLDGIIRSPPFHNHPNVDKLDQISGTQRSLPKLASFIIAGS